MVKGRNIVGKGLTKGKISIKPNLQKRDEVKMRDEERSIENSYF